MDSNLLSLQCHWGAG